MNDILDILFRAFDSSGFPQRWYCGTWSSALGWLHIVSDTLIFLAYVAIPTLLVYFIRRRPDVPFHKIFVLFAGFILCCGTGHLLEAVIFWNPIYRFAGMWKLLTAVVSVATVAALVPIVPQAMRIPGILKANKELKLALDTINRLRAEQEEIAYGVAHCLKEPVRALDFKLSTIIDDYKTVLPEEVELKLQETQRQGDRLHDMIEEMVMHANLMSAPLELVSVDLPIQLRYVADATLPADWWYSLNIDLKQTRPIVLDATLFSRALGNSIQWVIEKLNPPDHRLQIYLGSLVSDEDADTYCYEIRITTASGSIPDEELKPALQFFSDRDYASSLAVANRILRRLDGGVTLERDQQSGAIAVVMLFKECVRMQGQV